MNHQEELKGIVKDLTAFSPSISFQNETSQLNRHSEYNISKYDYFRDVSKNSRFEKYIFHREELLELLSELKSEKQNVDILLKEIEEKAPLVKKVSKLVEKYSRGQRIPNKGFHSHLLQRKVSSVRNRSVKPLTKHDNVIKEKKKESNSIWKKTEQYWSPFNVQNTFLETTNNIKELNGVPTIWPEYRKDLLKELSKFEKQLNQMRVQLSKEISDGIQFEEELNDQLNNQISYLSEYKKSKKDVELLYLEHLENKKKMEEKKKNKNKDLHLEKAPAYIRSFYEHRDEMIEKHGSLYMYFPWFEIPSEFIEAQKNNKNLKKAPKLKDLEDDLKFEEPIKQTKSFRNAKHAGKNRIGKTKLSKSVKYKKSKSNQRRTLKIEEIS
eukprot:TRINITY_DN2431_c0_g1_i1.p1 TRINITY_DN2431_c0_g1~~TRINITY_DN2431_c0_g1_i1.p1  ORF type:complete len:382 (-),score=128.37 TRINITY_DN2431_c0_g1_i1:698-1843(-)